jgi:hypothetical protein
MSIGMYATKWQITWLNELFKNVKYVYEKLVWFEDEEDADVDCAVEKFAELSDYDDYDV